MMNNFYDRIDSMLESKLSDIVPEFLLNENDTILTSLSKERFQPTIDFDNKHEIGQKVIMNFLICQGYKIIEEHPKKLTCSYDSKESSFFIEVLFPQDKLHLDNHPFFISFCTYLVVLNVETLTLHFISCEKLSTLLKNNEIIDINSGQFKKVSV